MKSKKSSKVIPNLSHNGKAVKTKEFKKITKRKWIGGSTSSHKVSYLGNVKLDISQEANCGLGIRANQAITLGPSLQIMKE